MIEVDVVIPSYNETERLVRAIRSVKAQTHPVSRIWVIDDGSNSAVVNELKEALNGDDQVEAVFLPHSGAPGISRHWAITRSTADWIAFLDSDDSWHPKKLEVQLALVTKVGALATFTNALRIYEGQSRPFFPETGFKQTLGFGDFINSNPVINSSVMVSREELMRVGGYCDSRNARAVEDYATWLRISASSSFVGCPEPLTFYSVSPAGLSHAGPDRRTHALVDFLTWSRERSSIGDFSGLTSKRIRILFRFLIEALSRA